MDGEKKGSGWKIPVVLLAVLALGVIGGAAFYLLTMIDERTAELSSGIDELRREVAKAEARIDALEERWKVSRLSPEANAGDIITSVNSLTERIATLEGALKSETTALKGNIGEQKSELSELRKSQAGQLARERRENEARGAKLAVGIMVNEARGRLLKAKVDILAKNMGLAAAELDAAVNYLEKLKQSATPEALKSVETQQTALKKAKTEITTDPAAALKRVDLIWYELDTLKSK